MEASSTPSLSLPTRGRGSANPSSSTPSLTLPTRGRAPVLTIGTRQRTSFDALQAQIAGIAQSSGARVGVSLIELGGLQPAGWSYNGDQQFTAASTYKLPVLMAEAQLVASNPAAANDQLCYDDSDWEDGWFQDYAYGSCYSRAALSQRIAQYSDNTAGHMMVRYLGGRSEERRV